MRFVCRKNIGLGRTDHGDFVANWCVDIVEHDEDCGNEYLVGRVCAKELMRFEAIENGFPPADVADADSVELESAYSMLCDWDGNFREADYDFPVGNIVVILAFVLHPSFSNLRVKLMERFCQLFESDSIVMIDHDNTVFSDAEFLFMGFRRDDQNVAPTRGFTDMDRSTPYMVRCNSQAAESGDWRELDIMCAKKSHETWVKKQADWRYLFEDSV